MTEKEQGMDYVTPAEVVQNLIEAGAKKSALSATDMLVRSILSGALLGIATTLALTFSAQTGAPIAGALVFPVGFVMIVLLGLELVTGNFALLPLAGIEKKTSAGKIAGALCLVFAGNLLGSLIYAALFRLTLAPDAPVALLLIKAAEAKTHGYAAQGAHGLYAAIAKAVLCNWMVTLGVVMAMTSKSTAGKIAAMWLPILTFFAQGFEHSVVNMFLIPAGMLFGAKVTPAEWWLWNQIPVTIGNFLGGAVCTALALWVTYRARAPKVAAEPLSVSAQASPAT
jgi:formate/nitrite transporter